MPRNKYPEETVKKILDASLKLFLTKGFEQTTVLDIVDNMGGLTRGAFYHHFKTKEDVLEAILNSDSQMYHPFEEAKHATVTNGLERFRLALKLALKVNLESEVRRSLMGEAISLLANPRFLAEHIKEVRADCALIEQFIEEGMADGSIRQGNPKLLAEVFALLANIWMMPSIFPCADEEMVAKAKALKEVMESLGCPVIDDEIEAIFFESIEIMNIKSG